MTYISPVIERLSGYKADDIIGFHFKKFIYPEDLPGVINSFKRALKGENGAYEFRLVGKTGSLFHVQTSSRVLKVAGKPTAISGVMTDITARKMVEEALRTSEQEKLAILHAIPDLMFRLDQNGVFLKL